MLVLLQVIAFGRQFASGFRPFVAPPQRVALSWDMFAVQIERCSMTWNVPVRASGRDITALHQLSAPFEWDVVYNTRAQYGAAADYACRMQPARRGVAKRYRLFCWLPGKTTERIEHVCG